MGEQLDILKRLQAIDGELYRLHRQREEKPQELEQVQAQLAAEDAKVKAAADRVKTLQLAQKEKEGELQTKEAHIKKLQGQLFQLKTNKEYATMQREIDGLKADNSLLEEDIIRALDAIDQAAKDRKIQEAQFATAQQQAGAERQRLEGELAEIEARIAQLERDRTTILPEVEAKTLAAYERVLRLREGRALVPIVNDACGGCDRRLPPQVVNEVYLKAKLVTCEHCSRILYFDEAHSKL